MGGGEDGRAAGHGEGSGAVGLGRRRRAGIPEVGRQDGRGRDSAYYVFLKETRNPRSDPGVPRRFVRRFAACLEVQWPAMNRAARVIGSILERCGTTLWPSRIRRERTHPVASNRLPTLPTDQQAENIPVAD